MGRAVGPLGGFRARRTAPAAVVRALWFVGMIAAGACSRQAPLAPSPLDPPPTRIVAVATRDGVLLKAERLDGAHQIEGLLEWQPATVWYQTFDLGKWWFSTADYEWVMVPRAGRVYWGVWRRDGASGDGRLGRIRLQGRTTIKAFQVWVDGRPAEAVMDDRGQDAVGDEIDLDPGPAPSAGVRGTSGDASGHRWLFVPPAGSQ